MKKKATIKATMKTSNYWFVDKTWLKQYAHNRILAQENDDRLIETETYTQLYERLMIERGSIMDIGAESATIRVHGAITETGPDLYDLLYGWGGLSYAELDSAVMEAHELLGKNFPIYMDFDTPGGDASGTELSYSLLREIAAERPLIGLVSGTMASAGVWLGSACTEIHALGRSKMIGSVGVATTVVDWSELYANWGIHIYDLTNEESQDKRPDNSKEEGRQVTITLLGEFYALFLEAVLEGRAGKTTKEKVEALKGAVVLSDRALQTGFIDSILEPGLNEGNSAASVASTKEEDMKLSEFLAQNPEAAAEIEKMKVDAKAEGAKEEKEAMNARTEKMKPFITGEYPAQIKQACIEGATGIRAVEGVMDFISLYDMQNEKKKAELSDGEKGTELKDTPPQDPAKLDAEKTQREVDANAALISGML